MFMYGKILEVNIDDKTMGVLRTIADPDNMKGYKYIKEEGDKVELVELAADNFAIVDRWVEMDKTPKSYMFDMEGALLMRNGVYVTLSELNSGDFVGIRYAAKDEDKATLRCAVARASHLE